MIHLLSVGVNGLRGELAALFTFIKDAFVHFTLLDAIDIILLTAVFSMLFNFLKGKKAGAILISIVFCSLVLLFSRLFGLDALAYIFSKIFDIGTLVLIIIFQPEIRGVLEKMGSGSISGILNLSEQRKKRQIYYSAIENICEAVKDFSANKTGALIAIVRTTKLDDVTSTGVVINADVNAHLIRNLFFNNAPLHDGAMVIDEAKIVAAGCLLPLTRRSDVDANLGTRHRAAIGLSEISDAIIIVVSEETGIVSVAYDYNLTRGYTIDGLKRFLTRKMLRNKKSDTD